MNNTDEQTAPGNVLFGDGAVGGIAIGRVFLQMSGGLGSAMRYQIGGDREIKKEVKRFEAAIVRVRRSFEGLRQTLKTAESQDPLLILQTHLELLEDPKINDETRRLIETERINAEWALQRVHDEIHAIFDKIEDEYIKARAEDVHHLCNRIQQELAGDPIRKQAAANHNSIVVTDILAPDLAIALCQLPVAGIVTESGSAMSHAAIIARTYSTPMVMGIPGLAELLNNGDELLIDGSDGSVTVAPSDEVLAQARRKQQDQAQRRQRFLEESSQQAITPDGFRVALNANIELPDEVPSAIRNGAESIGLYRTEYRLLTSNEVPDLGSLTDEYISVIRQLKGRTVTFRTIDLGGDKMPLNLNVPVGSNPALGLRGIRYSLRSPGLFRDQLRAILRASRLGPARILLPMVSDHGELVRARAIIDELTVEEQVEPLPVGVMIETPSSVMIADILACNADFFSIGSNDLIQYTLAVDRTDESVSYLYAPLHLSILRMLRDVSRIGHDAGIEVGVCGEIAGDPLFTLVLLGLQIDTLSMSPSGIPLIHAMIRRTPLEEARQLMQGVMALKDPDEVAKILQQQLRTRFSDLLGS